MRLPKILNYSMNIRFIQVILLREFLKTFLEHLLDFHFERCQTVHLKKLLQKIKIYILLYLSTMIQESGQSSQPSYLTARLFDFISANPSHIQSMSYCTASNKLYIARKLCSQVYAVNDGQTAKAVSIQQIMTFEPSQHIFEIDGLIVLVLPFQLKINNGGKWIVYPFTTQLLPLSTKFNKKTNKLYTIHLNQCRQWSISQDDGISIKYLAKQETPYHINSQGALEGYGKKIKPIKDNKFTVLEQSDNGEYLFVGSSKGQLSIYETKYLTHIKTFHRHQGSILSIKSNGNICYFTGSDSKISSIVYVNNQSEKIGNWNLSKQVRGQSHDIMSLQYVNLTKKTFLISGGITTDVCFYSTEDGILTDQWAHKISYSGDKIAHFVDGYIVVNKYSSFEIWKLGQTDQVNRESVDLLLKYEVPFYKNIRHILAKMHQKLLTIFVCTQQEASLWSFNQEKGLNKLLTVKNSYNLVSWHKKQCIITLREGNRLEIFNFTNGNIRQIAQTDLEHPTDIILSPGSQDRVLIGSKYSQQIQVYQIGLQKQGKRLFKLDLTQRYNVLDFCYYNSTNLMIKYSAETVIKQIDKKGNTINQIVKLPIMKVRAYGWLPFNLSQKKKIFWYAVSEGKIILVSRMKTFSKDKKIRVKQMPRINSVIVNHSSHFQWNIGVIPLNFTKMIQEQIQPIMTKKIL